MPWIDRFPVSRDTLLPGAKPIDAVDASDEIEAILNTVVSELVAGIDTDHADKLKATRRNKVRYTCPGCNLHLWGKPEVNVICGDCEEHLLEDC